MNSAWLRKGCDGMRSKMEVSGDWKPTQYYLNTASKKNPTNALRKAGSEGVKALQLATPRRTGETASGWSYKITTENGMPTVSFINNSHPETPVNVALLINYGHGTGTGGYVPARPFIKSALDHILSTAVDDAFKEVTS